jgi:hypothetical protein
MATFLKLICPTTGQPVWVNMGLVEAMVWDVESKVTSLLYPDISPDQVTAVRHVKEHPDTIVSVIASRAR